MNNNYNNKLDIGINIIIIIIKTYKDFKINFKIIFKVEQEKYVQYKINYFN